MVDILRRSIALLAVVAAVSATSCAKDPEVAKREYLERGHRYFEAKKYREAIIEYRNAVRLDPRFAEARQRLATSYLQTADVVNALREQVRAADLLPGDAGVQVEAGNLLLLVGRFEDAKARATKALAINPKDVGAQILLGNALAGTKDFDQAIAEVEEALKLDPDRVNTYASLGTLQLARGDRSAAEATFREAVARQPASVPAQLAFANFYWSTGQPQEAEALLERAVALAPRDSRTNRALANFLLSTGRTAEAERYLVTAAEVDPGPSARVTLADYYISAGRIDDAATQLRQVSEDPAWSGAARLRLASIEFREGRHAEAERLVDGILSADKSDTRARLLKANVLVMRNQLDGAYKHIQDAISADPRSARAYFALGKLEVVRRRPEDAKKAFTEALRVNPRAADAQVELSRLHLADGAIDKSLEFADRAVKTDPTSADARMAQVRALIALRKLDQAEPILSQLVTAFPKSAAVYTQMGLLRALRNDARTAARMFEQALALDPDYLEATAGLVSLDLAAGRPYAAGNRVAERVARTPDNSAALLLAGRTYASLGDHDKAEHTLKRALEVDALNLNAYESLGRFYMTRGRLPEAQREFESLAARQARPAASLTMVGMIQQSLNQPDRARQTYERVLQHDPNAAVAANNLAWLYVEAGVNLDLALQLARIAKVGLPKHPEVGDTLGWIFYQKGLLGQAIRELEETVRRDPVNPLYQYHLGLAYAKNGDTALARRSLEAALRLKSDFDGAEEAARLLSSL
jgi:putative PEP-CTERM system TPR-repeat lipoprotein